jgi:MFS family permease
MAGVIATLSSSFSPLKIRNFRIYLGGQAISLIGTWLQVTAQAWVVWELTKSEAALGVVNMLSSLPLLLLGPWAGVWADRLDRRKLLIGTQLGAMLMAFVLALLVQTGAVQLWHVYALAVLLGIVTALDFPAQQAFLGDLSGMGEIRKAVNLNAMILQTSRLIGPALAGFVVARLGSAPAFWLNGLSFLAVVVSLVLVRANQKRSPASGVSPLGQLWDAVRFVGKHPRMQDMFIFTAMITFFVLSIIMTQLPAVADKVLGGDAQTLGLLMASSGAGALAAVLVVVPITQAQRRSGLVLAGGTLWMAFWLMVFAASNWLPLSMFSLFMGSMGAPTVITLALGLIQLMSPADMRGRILSLFTMISFGLQPIASLWVGGLAQSLGVQMAIEINAIVLLAGALLILFLRADLRRWEVQLPAAPQPAPETA